VFYFTCNQSETEKVSFAEKVLLLLLNFSEKRGHVQNLKNQDFLAFAERCDWLKQLCPMNIFEHVRFR